MIGLPQSIDIWSLGCVYSMTATWLVLGYEGIEQFGNLRETAIAAIGFFRKMDSFNHPNPP